MLYSIGKFAKQIGVTVQTLRNWHESKELFPFKITNGGTRYYSEQQLQIYLNKTIDTKKEICIYSRVSNRGQSDDLKNQLEFLKTYCNSKGYITTEYTDFGSGLNFKRKQWNLLLDRVQKNEIEKIVITHKDRFIRFGFDWFESFCLKFGCTIEVINNEHLSPHAEMIQDLISIIHVFGKDVLKEVIKLKRYKMYSLF